MKYATMPQLGTKCKSRSTMRAYKNGKCTENLEEIAPPVARKSAYLYTVLSG